MSIEEFERRVLELLPRDEHGLLADDEALKLVVDADGCLSASFKGELIPCEGVPWAEALAVIVAFLEQRCPAPTT